MAVVSMVTTINLSNPTGSRRWVATAAAQDTSAGGAVDITITMTPVNLGPAQPDNTTLSLRIDDSQTVVRSYTLLPASASQTVTFSFTQDGQIGSALRSGTLRMRLDIEKSTGSPTDRYTVNSDGPTGDSLPALWSVQQRDQGWVRSLTSYSSEISNISLGGGKVEPAQFTEDMYGRVTLTAPAYRPSPVSVFLTSGAAIPRNTTVSSTATFNQTWSGTSITSGRVNRGFPAIQDSYTLEASPGGASLTGIAWTVLTPLSLDSISVDPRLTAVHLMQLDDNSYGSPPLIKQEPTGERPSTSIGYVSTAILPARGFWDETSTTGGIDGITLDVRLAAASGAGAPVTRSDTTTTRGGEPGWQSDFLIWTSALPGGAWDKNVTVTAPADIGGVSTYLKNATAQYQLLAARDPFIHLMVDVGHADPSKVDRHVEPGDTVEVAVYFKKTKEGERKLVEADANPVPAISFERIRGGLVESWTGSTWIPASPDLIFLPLTKSSTYVWTTTVVTDEDWGDVVVNVAAMYRAVQYDAASQKEFVGNSNGHDRYLFDGAGFLGFPSK